MTTEECVAGWGWRNLARTGFSLGCSAYVSLCSSDHCNTKGQDGISHCDIPQHAQQAQLKAEKHNSPPSLSVFSPILPSFFLLFSRLDCSVFHSFPSLLPLFESPSASRRLTSNWRGRCRLLVVTVYATSSIWAIFVSHYNGWSGLGRNIYSCAYL